MESSLTWSAGPPPLSVSMAIDVAGVVILAASVAVLAATTNRPTTERRDDSPGEVVMSPVGLAAAHGA
ncbi:MAG: hypothetical protein ACXWWO_06010 [Candidatus Limnocylindria bacterium]